MAVSRLSSSIWGIRGIWTPGLPGIFPGYGVSVPNTDTNCRVCRSPDRALVSRCDAAAGNVHCDHSHASPNLPALLSCSDSMHLSYRGERARRQDQRAEDAGHGVAKDRSSSAAKHSVTTVSCTAASAPKLGTAARPAAQSTAAVGASQLVSLTAARAAPTPSTSQGTAGVSAELPLWDILGSYSYSSILGMGFIPMPMDRNPPVPQAATQFGVVTSPVPPQVAPVQTVAPSATTTAATTTTLARGDYSFARAIECKPISTKHCLLPSTRLPTDIITIDEDPAEIVIDDDEPPESTPDLVPKDTSPEDKSPTVPQKKARVRAGDGGTVNRNFMALGAQVGST